MRALPPERFKDRPVGVARSVEDRAAELLRAAGTRPFPAQSVQRVRAALDEATAGRRRRPVRALGWTLAGGLLLMAPIAAALVGAPIAGLAKRLLDSSRTPRAAPAHRDGAAPAENPTEPAIRSPEAERSTPPVAAAALRLPPGSGRAASPQVEPSTAAVATAVDPPRVGAAHALRRGSGHAVAAPSTGALAAAGGRGSALAETLAEEASLLATALRSLRQEANAGAALAALDAYAERYPHGVLALEARVARVDALLLLGRRAEALSLLLAPGGPSGGGLRGAELELVASELLAEAGRFAEALPRFERVLSQARSDGLLERARFGTAVCLGALGRMDESRAALEAYLALHPLGRNAQRARAALEGRARHAPGQ